jgi:16S rRNA (uracil1498-N3)-methyltransferase
MQLFYSIEVNNEIIQLDRQESHHCISVLRHKAGDSILVTDGKGNRYEGIIEKDNPKRTELRILKAESMYDPFPVNLHLVVAAEKGC